MSVSESREVTCEGRSAVSDQAEALREALAGAMRELAAVGGGPPHLVSMRWESRNPAAIHPARRAADLAYREICGGFRPRPELALGAGPALVVTARARLSAPPAGPVWRGYPAADLAREYSPRGQVPDMAALFAGWTRDGEAFRANHGALDLAYGTSPAETLDLYSPVAAQRPPVWVFIHGGYWQASSKEQHAQFAAGMLRAGYAVANLDYGLAPETSLDGIVAQVRAALTFLAREGDALGIDASRLHLAGHSAGAHLAAMAACDPDGPPVRSVLLASGLFDLEPLRHTPVGRLLGLDPDAVRRLSPAHREPPPGLRVGVAVGAGESAEFQRQSHEFAAAWGADRTLVVEGANHFSLLDGFLGGPLLELSLRVAEEPGRAGDPAIAEATLADVDDIVALMAAVQDPGGAGLSQAMPPELVRRFVENMPCIVARRDGVLVGAILAQPVPTGDEAGPVTRAMLDAYPGQDGAYVYGPIAVAREERGRGLAQAMAAALVRALPGREGVLFIDSRNEPSLKGHAKMGARAVSTFSWQGRTFRVLALGGAQR